MLVSCLLIQSGCGIGSAPDPGSVTQIEFWHDYTGEQASILNMLVETYNSTIGGREHTVIVPVYKTIHEIETELTSDYDTGSSERLPNISVITNELAYQGMCRYLIVDAEAYLTKEELSGYSKDFLDEGRFTLQSGLYVFPIAKYSDIMIVNDSLWKYFYSDNSVKAEQLQTWNGLYHISGQYYEWSEGKAYIAFESLQNFVFTFAAQQLPPIIQAANKEIKINTNKNTLQSLWDFYYGGVVRGYISQSDDIQKSLTEGDIVCYIGKPHESGYFPKQYQNSNGELKRLDLLAFHYPSVSASRNIAPQNGYGVSVFDHGTEANQKAYHFLHWFCSNENIAQFSTKGCEISSYFKNYEESKTQNYFKKVALFDNVKYNMIVASLEQSFTGSTYAPTAFVGSESFCEELTKSLYTYAARGREAVVTKVNAGVSYESAVNQVDTDAAFEDWYQFVITLSSKY